MYRLYILIFLVSIMGHTQSFNRESVATPKTDSIQKQTFLKNLGDGFLAAKYFKLDLRYLVKYNQYESVRTGLGAQTSKSFSEKLRFNTYSVYGFRDHRWKYSFGGGLRLAPKTNTWLNVSYTDDLKETGGTAFLTDKRLFQFFEPRLLNISLFYKHITKAVSLEHQWHPKLGAELQFAVQNINPTYNYQYVLGQRSYNSFHLSTLKAAFQWQPFSTFKPKKNNTLQEVAGYPKFTFQYSHSLKNVLKSNLNFSKIDFRLLHKVKSKRLGLSEITLVSGLVLGNAPLTHLYHAYPNNINKETVLQRFSVAGLNSFETMYFNEFFSDQFTTVQLKHYFKPIKISNWFKPEVVLTSRYAIGAVSQTERHQGFNFSSLDKGYAESGIELNKLLFGFGLSFTYRYGAYHLPKIEDNFALKFTFNITL